MPQLYIDNHAHAKTCISRGENMLDSVLGEDWHWDPKLNLTTLDVSSCDSCVLGQLFGGYTTGKVRCEIMLTAGDFGFNLPGNSVHYRTLNDGWRNAIYRRRLLSPKPIEVEV